MSAKLEAKLSQRLEARRRERLIMKYGGIQWCPWCRQCVQEYDGWRFDDAGDGTDILTCGLCEGTSSWLFGMGMHLLKPLHPPKPIGGIIAQAAE